MHYPFDAFAQDVRVLARRVHDEFDAEAIVAISRGGMTLGHSLAVALENRNLFSLNSIHYDDTRKLDTVQIFNVPDLSDVRRILLVDDIVDSGDTIVAIREELQRRYPQLEVRVAALFYKQKARMQPDYCCHEAHEWVTFFWDISLTD